MGISRRGLVVVLIAATVLVSAFDGCLLDCHVQPVEASAQSHSHCHPAPAQQAGARWRVDPTCHHDHTTAAAESAMRPRSDTCLIGLVATSQTLIERPRISVARIFAQAISDRSRPLVTLVPLRV